MKTGHPPEVMAIAADAPLLRWEERTPWKTIAQMGMREREIHTNYGYESAGRAIAHLFTADVVKRMSIDTRDEADAQVKRFTCVALRHDQLVELLYRAYLDGQSSVRSMNHLEAT